MPPTESADMAERRDDPRVRLRVPYYTDLLLFRDGFREERKFYCSSTKLRMWGGSIFLVLSSCLGKDLGLLPTHQEMKKKVAYGLESEHLLTITLLFSQ